MHRHSEIATGYVLDTIATRTAPTILIGVDPGFSDTSADVMFVGDDGIVYSSPDSERGDFTRYTTSDGVSSGYDPGPRKPDKVYPSTAHGIAAALKAEAPHVPLLDNEHRIAQRAARAVRMARKRRRGW